MARLAQAALCLCIGAFILSGRAYAADAGSGVGKGTFGLGLNYPGLGLRYFLNDRNALEAKAQVDKDVVLGGLRLYNYFRPAPSLSLFIGGEADYVHYKGEISRGSGAAGQIFGGFEYFVLPSVSLQADFGPAYVYLKDQRESVSVNGIEYAANFGFNFYWGGESKAGRSGRANRSMKNKPRHELRPQRREPTTEDSWLIY
ncbi:MAG: hypothetical protein WC881_11785 [Elusimicrobiota bacterium]|jgi:hypothetical protein